MSKGTMAPSEKIARIPSARTRRSPDITRHSTVSAEAIEKLRAASDALLRKATRKRFWDLELLSMAQSLEVDLTTS